MIRNPRIRRASSLLLMATGGALLFLATEQSWIGAVLLAMGVALEIFGAMTSRRK
jgi:hypothetical protein